MDDYEYLDIRYHEPSTCGTCRTRRGEPMVCAICQRPIAPDGVVMLYYTSRETIDHLGTVHASCSAFIDHEASDDTFIRY
jgi:hypothetical protein